jgi:hypothetical protein
MGEREGQGIGVLNPLPLAIAIEALALAAENLSPPARSVDREDGRSFLSIVDGHPDAAVSLAPSPPWISPE